MGQPECLDFIKSKNGGWISAPEIAAALGLSYGSVRKSLMSLRKFNQIKFKDMREYKKSGQVHAFYYSYKTGDEDGSTGHL